MEMENRSGYEENLAHPNPEERQFNTMRIEDSKKLPIDNYAEIYTPRPNGVILWAELLIVFAVSMGLLVGGFYIDYTTSATPSILNSTMNKDSSLEILLASTSMPLQVAVGAFLAAPLLTYAGRRYSLMGVGVQFFIGWSISAFTSNLYLLLVGQVLCAICTGVLLSVFPVYIVETVQPEIRGALGILPITFRYGGTTLSYLAAIYMDWSKMAYLATLISLIFFLLMLATPESPRWYINKGHTAKARKSLQWLRGQDYNIENEIQNLTRTQTEADTNKVNAFRQMFYMENIPTVLILLELMLFQQLNGSNVMIYYSQTIFEKSSAIDVPLFSTILLVTSIIATLISVVLIDRIGRKILLYISSCSMVVSFVLFGTFAYIQELNESISVGWLPAMCVVLHIFGSSLGYETIPWLMLGEILPFRIRGTAASLITGANWICSFYVAFSFINIITSSTVYGVLFLFVVIHLIEILFVIFCVPETRGKTLEEIELNLTQRVKNVNCNADANVDA